MFNYNSYFLRSNYLLYLNIALCDLLNGVGGMVTAGFLITNLRYDQSWSFFNWTSILTLDV